jgi:hypothetical protein
MGKNMINIGNPFKTKKEIIISIIKEGKKLTIFANIIEMGIRKCGKLDSLIKFLLSIRQVVDDISESWKKRQGNTALIKYKRNGASSILTFKIREKTT